MGREALSDKIVESAVPSIEEYVRPDGTIVIPDGITLTSFLDRNREVYGDAPAYRFLDYTQGTEGRAIELSWNGMWAKVGAVGARLQQVTTRGDRVAILAPQGVDYVAAFFAAIHAGNIAVPLFAPALAGHTERLAAVLADAKPTVVLTTTAGSEAVRNFLRTLPAAERPRMIAVDAVPDAVAQTFSPVPLETDDVAYLQYTSGSTRTPAGVEITHRNVCTNVLQMVLAGDLDMGVRSVSWLPLYHDMGLIMIMFPALCGAHITLMDPMAFVRRPYRWIKALGIESAHGRTFAAAPNFAFDLAAERGLPPSGDDLDLTNVVTLLNGSEPVTLSSIEKFTAAFAPYGLPATAIKPSYGMAEATLSVASIAPSAAAEAVYLDRAELNAGRAVVVDAGADGAVAHVSCGQPIPNQWAVIASPDGEELPDGTVGEIWLHGNNVGRGYFGRAEETLRVFGNKLQTRLRDDSHADDVPDNGLWLATGDLGVYLDGELYLTGRIKDMIIVDGRNHYPTDIETTVSAASPAVRSGYVAAFSVPGTASEELVIVAERAAGSGRAEPGPIVDAIRAAVSRNHQVRVADIRMVAAGVIPRTTSGKLARNACRTEYLAGKFDR
ncbi:fatty acyl-AMP ligase [Mycolicibacterium fluoranthenivorans]|uniref:fatty acyl-AMP ligase n=1 Tax=Mycolicibacterium fluoranthenivorans TaxID=258505 RepID=UPI001420A793|nr:fatty acyl-AMP ligase [Mycolicibacterium fluoranthenivorans]MCV7355601.1 AMP-binding protein [Mycolicibacterium fluoranthenivorans]